MEIIHLHFSLTLPSFLSLSLSFFLSTTRTPTRTASHHLYPHPHRHSPLLHFVLLAADSSPLRYTSMTALYSPIHLLCFLLLPSHFFLHSWCVAGGVHNVILVNTRSHATHLSFTTIIASMVSTSTSRRSTLSTLPFVSPSLPLPSVSEQRTSGMFDRFNVAPTVSVHHYLCYLTCRTTLIDINFSSHSCDVIGA
jgi:hypothetical protein